MNLMRPRLAAARVALQADLSPSLPKIRGQRDELEMALLNLVTNALDAMPGGGTLRCRDDAGRQSGHASSSPIPAPESRRSDRCIFDPWVTTKPEGHGTGLGLAITRDVITPLWRHCGRRLRTGPRCDVHDSDAGGCRSDRTRCRRC